MHSMYEVCKKEMRGHKFIDIKVKKYREIKAETKQLNMADR
jgi:hypothetical protein